MRLMEHFADGARRVGQRSIPMTTYHPVRNLQSTRRQEEIVTIRWADYRSQPRPCPRHETSRREGWQRYVVRACRQRQRRSSRSMPRALPGEYFRIQLLTQSRAAFTRACTRARHRRPALPRSDGTKGCSRLFELGWTIPQVASVSGHRSWQSLKRYSHLRQTGDKLANWQWAHG